MVVAVAVVGACGYHMHSHHVYVSHPVSGAALYFVAPLLPHLQTAAEKAPCISNRPPDFCVRAVYPRDSDADGGVYFPVLLISRLVGYAGCHMASDPMPMLQCLRLCVPWKFGSLLC